MPVYLIRAGEDGPVKIGRATNVLDRIANLQCGHYQKLVLLRTISHNDAAKAETWLHHHFFSMQIMGEWFRFHEAMMSIDVPVDFSVQPAVVPRTMPEWFYETPSQRRRKRSKLDAFLEDNGITRVSLAARIGVSPSYVSSVCCGGNWGFPKPDVITRIERETGGAVTAADFVERAKRVLKNDPKRTGFSHSRRTQEDACFLLASAGLAS